VTRVLVAEDDPDMAALIGSILQDRLGINSEHVANGALVLQGQADPPDLLILDVALPGLNGIDVFDVLRGDARWANVPVLFLTAMPQRAERTISAKGAREIIGKPFDVDALVAKVAELLSRVEVRA
jgi:two-component system, sensor histidine kinase and response regulator